MALISLQQRGWPLKNATNILTSMDKFVTAVLRTVGDRDRGGAENNFSSKRRALKKDWKEHPTGAIVLDMLCPILLIQHHLTLVNLAQIFTLAHFSCFKHLNLRTKCSFVTRYFSDAIMRYSISKLFNLPVLWS